MNNKSSKIIIIILTILVIGLTGYIVYDKVLSKNQSQEDNKITNNEENNKNENDEKSDHVELDANLKKELLDVFAFVYDYKMTPNAYCGGYINGDIITPEDPEVNGDNIYTASSKYKSYDEMIAHLKQYMTEHVIYGHYYMGKDNGSYIERDGKLYCASFGKGSNIYQLTNTTITYSKPYTNEIYIKIETELTYEGHIYEYYDVTFSKRGDKWIISSFEYKDQFTFSDFAGTVFQNKDGDEQLILWDNGTYSYEESLGNYIIEGHTIKLNYLYENNKKVTEEKSIEFRIVDKTQIYDHKNRKLVKVNQPTSPGGEDFYYYTNE